MGCAVFDALARAGGVRQYAAAFHQATGVRLRLFSADAKGALLSFGPRENPFCVLVHQTAGGCEACLKTRAELQRRFSHKLAPHQLRCAAGLTEVAVPVLVAGKHAATLCGGQIFLRKPSLRQFARVARWLTQSGCGHDLSRAKAAYFRTPVLSPEQFRGALRLLTFFAQHLGESASRWMIAGREDKPPPVSAAMAFVQEHTGEPLRMHDAAQHVHLSPVYFCKMFSKTTGVHFSEYVCRVRLEKAKQLLAHPFARISEVAYASGFGSMPHFDRAFKKYVGVTPKEYRASQHAQLLPRAAAKLPSADRISQAKIG